MGHALMANRNGLIVQEDLKQADGHAERRAALDMIHRHFLGSTWQLTLGADKGFDAVGFVADLRQACVTSDVAQKSRYSAIDGRTTRNAGHALSIKHRKRTDLCRENDPPDGFMILLTFGRARTVGGKAQTVHRGLERVRSRFILTMAASNLARLPRPPAASRQGAASGTRTDCVDQPHPEPRRPIRRKSVPLRALLQQPVRSETES